MATNLWAGLVAEKCDREGPTGEFVEVLEVAVEDFGGNEYGRATTAAGVARIQKRLRIPTQLRAVRTGQPVSGGDVDCGFTS